METYATTAYLNIGCDPPRQHDSEDVVVGIKSFLLEADSPEDAVDQTLEISRNSYAHDKFHQGWPEGVRTLGLGDVIGVRGPGLLGHYYVIDGKEGTFHVILRHCFQPNDGISDYPQLKTRNMWEE